jgi:pyruvate ferredoxin oxidoreductase gamma subunit
MTRTGLTEIRIHGRGGQGNVIAAYLLATAAFEAGRFGQAFPSFGPERRGAPVASFVRIAEHPVRRRSQVRNPAFLIIQDEKLLHVHGITDGLLPGGGILVNSRRVAKELSLVPAAKAIAIPATALAAEILGVPVPNTALIAAFLALTELLPLEALEKALARRFEGEMLQRNARLIREAATRVPAGLWKEEAQRAATA